MLFQSDSGRWGRFLRGTGLIIVAALIIVALTSAAAATGERLGLVLVAHGAPMPSWNAPVLALEDEVRGLLTEDGDNPFDEVRVALMEFTEPSIHTVIGDLEEAGIDRAYVLPLFIAPSGHSLFDIPAILGLYSDPAMLDELRGEGTEIVGTDIRLTVGPTLNYGDILRTIMLDRVREMSVDPALESLVLLAHGDASTEPVWDALCNEIGVYVCAHTGIEYFDHALVEVGQSFATEGLGAIAQATEHAERTLVVGLYLSMGVENMAKSAMVRSGMMTISAEDVLKDEDIRYGGQGVLPDPRVAAWAVERAGEWLLDQGD